MKKLIHSLVYLFTLVVLMVTVSYAWFINSEFVKPESSGYSISAYFASGDGSSNKPYVISNKRHLYNFAWLQYLGYFNKVEDAKFNQNYFVLSNDIDMDNMYLPPIGTQKYPFIGNFNGNGYSIKNLKTTNKFEDLKNHPNSVNSFSNCEIIGFFGIVGKYDSMDNYNAYVNSNINNVSNFNLLNTSVHTSANSSLIGILAGYVNANVSYIGVNSSNLLIDNNVSSLNGDTKISNYTLIGDYNSNEVNWEGNNGQGDDFGSSFDINGFYNAMSAVYKNNKNDIIEATDSSYTLKDNCFFPLTSVGYPTKDGTNEIDYDNLKSTSELKASEYNNGYFIGKESKLQQKQIVYDGKIYIKTGNNSTDIRELSNSEYLNLPSGIKSFYDENVTSKTIKEGTIRLQKKLESGNQNYLKNQIIQIREYDKNTKKSSSKTYTNATIPANGIWFRPSKVGKIRILFYADEDNTLISIYKFRRDNISSNINFNDPINATLNKDYPKDKLFLIELDVTEDDLADGYEYALGKHENGKGAYILYLDIATSNNDSYEKLFIINNIDFVYYENNILVSLKNDNYIKSYVLFYIDGLSTAVVQIEFERKTQAKTIYFTYNGTTNNYTADSSDYNPGGILINGLKINPINIMPQT